MPKIYQPESICKEYPYITFVEINGPELLTGLKINEEDWLYLGWANGDVDRLLNKFGDLSRSEFLGKIVRQMVDLKYDWIHVVGDALQIEERLREELTLSYCHDESFANSAHPTNGMCEDLADFLGDLAYGGWKTAQSYFIFIEGSRLEAICEHFLIEYIEGCRSNQACERMRSEVNSIDWP